ncbi:MAG: hypothetical protein OEZ43_08680 [Gammaproteobacteria bacterium]|nr:hypothetical protein [Gammaproteobacteria bacterium]
MKDIKVTDIGAIKNELRKYKAGAKLDINQFNQVARIAWLGKLVMQPLDPMDANAKSFLVYVDDSGEFIEHFLRTDQDLLGRMHIVDGDQAQALIKVMEQGFAERSLLYQDLKQRDFYFEHFYQQDAGDSDGA